MWGLDSQPEGPEGRVDNVLSIKYKQLFCISKAAGVGEQHRSVLLSSRWINESIPEVWAVSVGAPALWLCHWLMLH